MRSEKVVFLLMLVILIILLGSLIHNRSQSIPCFDFEIDEIEQITFENNGAKWNCGKTILKVQSANSPQLCLFLSKLTESKKQSTRVASYRIDIEVVYSYKMKQKKSYLELYRLKNGDLTFDQGNRQFENQSFSNYIIEQLEITSYDSSPCY